jgi:CheY-like chemotaxis protein
MSSQAKNIVLAEDDEDDSQFFEEALKSVSDPPSLIRAKDGVELTNLLKDSTTLPDLIFLDINMPRKNGVQCLREIRQKENLAHVPVVILSTTSSEDVVESMYQSGANLYVQKPSDFSMWKRAIAKVLKLDWNIHTPFSVKENFTLTIF